MADRPLLLIAFLLSISMLLLGGGLPFDTGESEIQQGPVDGASSFDGSTSTLTTTQSPHPESTQAPRETSKPVDGPAASSAPDMRRLEPLIAGFYEKLDSADHSRKEVTIDVAKDLCHHSKTIRNVSSASGKVTSAEEVTRRLQFGVEIIRENFNTELSPDALDLIRSKAGSLAKFTPVVGSFNQMREDACSVSSNPNAESIEDFYISTTAFGVEAGIVQYGFYESAFSTTRSVANSVDLAKLRSVCGDRCYALAMSEIHWAIRGAPIGATEFIREKAREADISVNVTSDLTQYVVDNQGLKYAKQTIVSCSAYVGEDVASIGSDAIEEGSDLADADGDGEHGLDDIQSGAEGLFSAAKNTTLSDIRNGTNEAASVTMESVSKLNPEKIYNEAGGYLGKCSE